MATSIPKIKLESNPTEFTPIPVVKTVVHIRLSIAINDMLVVDRHPSEPSSPDRGYEVVNPNVPAFEIALHEEDMCFQLFKEKVFDRIMTAATEVSMFGLRGILDDAENRSLLEWVYSITEDCDRHSAHTWSMAEAGIHFSSFVAAVGRFSHRANVALSLKLGEEAIIEGARDPPPDEAVVPPVAPDLADTELAYLVNVETPNLANAELPDLGNVELPNPAQIDAVYPNFPPVAPPPVEEAREERNPPPAADFTMNEFLSLCHIDSQNVQIQGLLERHLISHWRAFVGLSSDRLEQLGFPFGPSALIAAGTLRAINQTIG
ncbi:hypothetical protein PGTUg99_022129 [Puccinia graminis f. sp. tritici]|uniref:Uncharacterized protein n=1 Tax=Puccinia graminis f. sp. tritici TaxID=56615 RepID=A0A5B0QH24_PUCGR|nr:hypothetical protein PGTUg99_022129 [Puccinia graminis f. sp. tritici]